MPFKLTDLMLDVLPEAPVTPGLLAQGGKDDKDDDDASPCPMMTNQQSDGCADEDDLCPMQTNSSQSADCKGVTAEEGALPLHLAADRLADLGLLRQQLRTVLREAAPAG